MTLSIVPMIGCASAPLSGVPRLYVPSSGYRCAAAIVSGAGRSVGKLSFIEDSSWPLCIAIQWPGRPVRGGTKKLTANSYAPNPRSAYGDLSLDPDPTTSVYSRSSSNRVQGLPGGRWALQESG